MIAALAMITSIVFGYLAAIFIRNKWISYPLSLFAGAASSVAINIAPHFISPELVRPGDALANAAAGLWLYPLVSTIATWWYRHSAKKRHKEPAKKAPASVAQKRKSL